MCTVELVESFPRREVCNRNAIVCPVVSVTAKTTNSPASQEGHGTLPEDFGFLLTLPSISWQMSSSSTIHVIPGWRAPRRWPSFSYTLTGPPNLSCCHHAPQGLSAAPGGAEGRLVPDKKPIKQLTSSPAVAADRINMCWSRISWW